MAWLDAVRYGPVRQVRYGGIRTGLVWYGRLGKGGSGLIGRVTVRQVSLGAVW
jgi:hypothetical protein